jgi:hypothetical protein
MTLIVGIIKIIICVSQIHENQCFTAVFLILILNNQ